MILISINYSGNDLEEVLAVGRILCVMLMPAIGTVTFKPYNSKSTL